MAFDTARWDAALSALDARDHMMQLLAERALALSLGLGDVAPYMADLDAELEHRRNLYMAAVVTEVATLRGELFGRQVG